MSSENYNIHHGTHYSVFQIQDMADLSSCTFTHKSIPATASGKLFLSQILNCTGSIISLNLLAPHTSMPFFHRHVNNEEVYLFIKGNGQFLIDEETIPIKEGTALRISPNGARSWRNQSNEILYYIVIQGPLNSFPLGQTIEDGRIVTQ
ncbi:cupin domain-containing protein [Celerinatantimonas sp. YJH-8]|uniref:cupin domain-containing protein n=1 Tax=Celerinatantimonas sp. YJH-8 TaxID=3228714 RepID=UPI0038C12B92